MFNNSLDLYILSGDIVPSSSGAEEKSFHFYTWINLLLTINFALCGGENRLLKGRIDLAFKSLLELT